MKVQTRIRFSIVVPIFNEEGSAKRLYIRLTQVMRALGQPYEIVFVDDGSTDCSPAILGDIQEADSCVRIVTLRRNFGQTPALKAGFADLIRQLNRHKDLLRNGHKWTREKGTITELEELRTTSVGEEPKPLPKTSRKQNSAQDTSQAVSESSPGNGHATPEEITAAMFELENQKTVQSEVRKYLAANLPRLERFVARELRFREANGQLPTGVVSREEVIDEVVLAALSVEQRPTNISLEKWFYRLASTQ